MKHLVVLTRVELNRLVEVFKNLDVWGSAFWQWRVDSHQVKTLT